MPLNLSEGFFRQVSILFYFSSEQTLQFYDAQVSILAPLGKAA